MTAVLAPAAYTVADLIEQLGSVPPNRILLRPTPGTATEADLAASPDRGIRQLCELVDGTLVRKPMGYYESRLAIVLAFFLEQYLSSNRLGIVLGADAFLRLAPGLVRLPDVSFILRSRLPRPLSRQAVLNLAPDLAVEILSSGNTPAEMERKLREYFEAGVRLVWILDAERQSLRAYTSPDSVRTLGPDDVVDGGEVLPGFSLPLREWFARAECDADVDPSL